MPVANFVSSDTYARRITPSRPSAVNVNQRQRRTHLQIQLKASCMVRIATSGMYYPGTMERAVLVAGEIDGVKVRTQEDKTASTVRFGGNSPL